MSLPKLKSLSKEKKEIINNNTSSETDEYDSEKYDTEESDNESDDSEYEKEESNNSKEYKEYTKLDDNASFFVTFVDGSSFRYLIEYLRLISEEGSFVFHPKAITYVKGNEDMTILNVLKIKTYELTDYEFISFNDKIIATINLADLRNKTGTVGKKDQLDIYRRQDEPSNLYIQMRSQEKSTGDDGMLYCMHMTSDTLTEYEDIVYTRDKTSPVCTVYQSDFSKLCKQLCKNKSSYIEFIVYENGIVIQGYDLDGKAGALKKYGNFQEEENSKISNTKSMLNVKGNTKKSNKKAPKLKIRDKNEIERYKVDLKQIKALAKINGFSSNSTIKFYAERGLPMRLDCNIGTFGKLSIYIRSFDE